MASCPSIISPVTLNKSLPLTLSSGACTLAIYHSGWLWDLNYWSNTPNGIIPCQHVADPGIGLPPGPDLPSASLLPSSLGPSGQRGPWQSPNPSTPVREGCTTAPPPSPHSWASISLIHWAGAPWEWSGHMASPRFCLLVPSESTHPRRREREGHTMQSLNPYWTAPRSHQHRRLYLGWCCSESVWQASGVVM